jgi:hypothetical protein
MLLFEQRSQDADIHYLKISHMRANFRKRENCQKQTKP